MHDELALLGGQAVTAKSFPPPNTIGEAEKKDVLEVLDSGVLSGFIASPGPAFFGGPRVLRLERAWAEYFGIKHAVAMNSATSALYAAVSACDIGPGDEVINSPLTMCATPSAALVNNAVPVFADVDPRTMNLDAGSVAEHISERTRAVFVVHLAGHPCDMDPIMALAREHGLFVLEDNAQAPGALYKGRFAGCIGDIGVFSLNCHKTIQSGEGGVAVTDDDDLAMRLRLIRNHGEKCVEGFGLADRCHLIGQNYRMTEMEAAVAFHQLGKLKMLNDWRTGLAEYFSQRLRTEFDCIEPPHVSPDCTHVYYVYHMQYDEVRGGVPIELLVEAVRAEGIQLGMRWGEPLYRLPVYRQRSAYGRTGCPFEPPWSSGTVRYEEGLCPRAESTVPGSLFIYNLMCWPNAEDDVELAVRALRKVFDGRDALLAHAAQRKELSSV